MKKVVVAIDSFKGSITSVEAAEASRKGIRDVYPESEVICFSISDGGEGVLPVLMSNTDSRTVSLSANNPLMESVETQYGISSDGNTAFIEMAAISGLLLVPENQRNPMITTSYGTGELIKDALERGCRNFIIGIGGSATNDAGLGMLQALGYRFSDKNGRLLRTGGRVMEEVFCIDSSAVHPFLKEAHFAIACDVNNPFCGPAGAAYVYAPQKGADTVMVEKLDNGMRSLAKVIHQETGVDIADYPGAGAAGGTGGAFLAFMNSTLRSGIDLLLDWLEFDQKIENADLVLTGEGKIDRQTLMGKVPYGVLKRAQKQQIPVVAIAGSIEDVEEINRAGFRSVFSIVSGPVALEKAMEPEYAKENMTRLVRQICYTTGDFNGY